MITGASSTVKVTTLAIVEASIVIEHIESHSEVLDFKEPSFLGLTEFACILAGVYDQRRVE